MQKETVFKTALAHVGLSIRRMTIHWLHVKRADRILNNQIIGMLRDGERVLDLGAGTCHICSALKTKGMDVTPVDIKNRSYFPEISPMLFDGETIPFADNEFDVTLLIAVLHHARNQSKLVAEAMRVSRRLLVVEDVYDNSFMKYVTFFFDSVGNLEVIGHPHGNRTSKEWHRFFEGMGLTVRELSAQRMSLVYKNALFLVERR